MQHECQTINCDFCRDGVPYCEKDYQKNFGVRCAYCNRFISGKVLQVRVIIGEGDKQFAFVIFSKRFLCQISNVGRR